MTQSADLSKDILIAQLKLQLIETTGALIELQHKEGVVNLRQLEAAQAEFNSSSKANPDSVPMMQPSRSEIASIPSMPTSNQITDVVAHQPV